MCHYKEIGSSSQERLMILGALVCQNLMSNCGREPKQSPLENSVQVMLCMFYPY